jgi:hypothetical protein
MYIHKCMCIGEGVLVESTSCIPMVIAAQPRMNVGVGLATLYAFISEGRKLVEPTRCVPMISTAWPSTRAIYIKYYI